MNVVKRYEVISITPACAEDEDQFLVVRLETKDQMHPNIDIRIQKQAIRFIAGQIADGK
jgi:hypothetical protein